MASQYGGAPEPEGDRRTTCIPARVSELQASVRLPVPMPVKKPRRLDVTSRLAVAEVDYAMPWMASVSGSSGGKVC